MKCLRRFVFTAGIWGGLMVPMYLAIAYYNEAELSFGFALLIAIIMTVFIWMEERIFARFGYYKQNDSYKRKNANQNADAALLLLELLSDDERQNIRQRLVRGNDGEIPQFFANEGEAEYSERY